MVQQGGRRKNKNRSVDSFKFKFKLSWLAFYFSITYLNLEFLQKKNRRQKKGRPTPSRSKEV
jgi:hypothetical protein